MPEPITFVTAIIGIAVVGLTLASVDVVKSVGQWVGIALLALLTILLINRLSLSNGISQAPLEEAIDYLYGPRAQIGWQFLPYQLQGLTREQAERYIRPQQNSALGQNPPAAPGQPPIAQPAVIQPANPPTASPVPALW